MASEEIFNGELFTAFELDNFQAERICSALDEEAGFA